MLDYEKQPLEIGDTIKNIENGWRGKIIGVETINGDTMLVCRGINWWDGEVDEDDEQWHSPADVIKQPTQAPQPGEAPSPLNFL